MIFSRISFKNKILLFELFQTINITDDMKPEIEIPY